MILIHKRFRGANRGILGGASLETFLFFFGGGAVKKTTLYIHEIVTQFGALSVVSCPIR